VSGRPVIIGVLASKKNRLENLAPLVEELIRKIEAARPGSFVASP
jgi:hypothetical protein